jgi:hypothetical protein
MDLLKNYESGSGSPNPERQIMMRIETAPPVDISHMV